LAIIPIIDRLMPTSDPQADRRGLNRFGAGPMAMYGLDTADSCEPPCRRTKCEQRAKFEEDSKA